MIALHLISLVLGVPLLQERNFIRTRTHKHRFLPEQAEEKQSTQLTLFPWLPCSFIFLASLERDSIDHPQDWHATLRDFLISLSISFGFQRRADLTSIW